MRDLHVCLCGHGRHSKRCLRPVPGIYGMERCGCPEFFDRDICRKCGVYVEPPEQGEWVPPAMCEPCYMQRHAVMFGLKGLVEYFSPVVYWPFKKDSNHRIVGPEWLEERRRLKARR